MNDELRKSYDAFPYQSFPFPQTHPDRLAAIGWIFGLAAPGVERCRVLELGCASGGNLLPLAASLPHSEFVGVDFSDTQIRQGLADVDALGLTNVRLARMDIMDLGEDLGTFDYIIAHGVYSWVPNAVQEKILHFCSRQLAGNGIAYISYNTLPGWGMRGAVRAAMRYHTRQFDDPQSRVQQGRAMLEFLAQSAQNDASAYGVMLRAAADEVRRKPDYYILHEHLEEVNEPLYFYQFIERTTRHGLRYLGEAMLETMFANDLAPEVAQTLMRIAPDLMKREQFLDFMRNRTFRQTLLVHDSVNLERKLSPLRVTALRVASRARPVRENVEVRADGAGEFRVPDGNGITTPHAICKTALALLAENWPGSWPFDELLRRAAAAAGVPSSSSDDAYRALVSMLLTAYAAGVVELHTAPPPFTLDPGEHPEAGSLQRLQAQRGNWITSLRHESVNVDDTTRLLLPLLDGRRARHEIAGLAWPGEPHVERKLVEALTHIARQALLVTPAVTGR